MAILEWLAQKWTIITDWFSGYYWTWRYAVSNLTNTITEIYQTILTYYERAKDYVYGKIDEFYNTTIRPKLDDLGIKSDGLTEDLQNLWDWATDSETTFIEKIEQAKEAILDLVSQVWGILIINIRTQWDDFISRTWPEWKEKLNGLVKHKSWLDAIVRLVTPQWISDLINAWEKVKPFVVRLADDPIGFIIDTIKPVFLIFLDYLLGYALGTTKYNLPKWPVWKNLKGK